MDLFGRSGGRYNRKKWWGTADTIVLDMNDDQVIPITRK